MAAMTTIACCGIGGMGGPMARRLMSAGHDVRVWNRTAAKADGLVAVGAARATTPRAAAAGAEVVITTLADPVALVAVTEGDDGVLAGVGPGATLIEMSTVGPSAIARLAGAVALAADRVGGEVGLLDAPVLGSTPQAEAGELAVFVGGPPELAARWKPLLSVLGAPTHVGPSGSGAAMKLVANSTLGGTLAILGEALGLADGLGLPRDAVFDVLARTPIGAQSERRRAAIEADDFPLHFRLALAEKDLALIGDAAAAAGLELRMAEAARAWFADAVAAGLGDRDYASVIGFITRSGPGHPER